MSLTRVDSLTFDFPNGWCISKFDDWIYYKKHFKEMYNYVKAVDLIALDSYNTLWLIESKDFRHHRRQKKEPIYEEIWFKVCWTLSALLPASLLANKTEEADFARKALGATKLRVVFHCEQPRSPSRLFPQVFDPSSLQIKLRSMLKPIDPHFLVVSRENMPASLEWRVF